MKLKRRNIFSIAVAFLFFPLINFYAQSPNFLKSTAIYGHSPSQVISQVTLNGPTPLEVIGNPFSQPNIPVDISYVNSYSPWDNLTTRAERISMIEQMIKDDKFDTKVDSLKKNAGWVCADISIQEQINFYGISNIDEFVKTIKTRGGTDYLKNNNRNFNVPVYIVNTISDLGDAHSVNGVLVGDDPLNFNDWYFWSDYFGIDKLNIKPGDPEMKDGPVSIQFEAYVKYPTFKDPVFANGTIINFNLINGNPSLVNKSNYLVLKNPNIIKVHIGSLERIVVDSGKFLNGTSFTPEFLQSHGYRAIPDTSKENTDLPVNLSYIDSDTTKLADSGLGGKHYKFLRKFFSWIYSGGITKLDSTNQEIEIDKLTDVKDDQAKIPNEFVLYQNYPNPFNPTTTIKYSIPDVGRNGISTNKVFLKVFDLLGREVETLVNEEKAPGNYEVTFNVETRRGESLPSGVYFYSMQAGSYYAVKKLVVLK